MIQYVVMYLLLSAVSLKISGTTEGKDVDFVGKFCYDFTPDATEEVGTFSFVFTIPYVANFSDLDKKLVIYDDQSNSWPAIWGSALTCSQKIEFNDSNKNAETSHPRGLPVQLDFELNDDKTAYVATYDGVLQQHVRPRWWFLAVSQCSEKIPYKISYEAHFVNTLYSSWDEEFGANDQGVNSAYLTFFIVWTLLMPVFVYSFVQLRKSVGFVHPLMRIFLAVLLCEYASVLFGLIYNIVFSTQGYDHNGYQIVSDLLELVSRILFVLVLLLISKGWLISREESVGWMPIVVSLVIFFIANVGLIIWQADGEDPTQTSVDRGQFGFSLVLLQCWFFFAVLFLYAIVNTRRNETNPFKKSLYLRMSFFFVWMFGPPTVVALSFALDDWARERVVRILTLLITSVGYWVFAAFMWPSRAEAYFSIQRAGAGSLNQQTQGFYEQL